jgi:hypothetical protein
MNSKVTIAGLATLAAAGAAVAAQLPEIKRYMKIKRM